MGEEMNKFIQILNLIMTFVGFGYWIFSSIQGDNHGVIYGMLLVVVFQLFYVLNVVEGLKKEKDEVSK